MNFVFLYGPPGVGKLTVAGELASLIGYRLFDNHVSIDAVRRVFDFSDEPFWPLVLGFRFDVYEAAARHGIDLITTGAYVYPEDTELAESWFKAVERHNATVLLVHLTCRREVLAERVRSEGRGANKQTTLDDHDYLTPIPNRPSLHIDNSELTPRDAARQIAAQLRLASLARTADLSRVRRRCASCPDGSVRATGPGRSSRASRPWHHCRRLRSRQSSPASA